MPIAPSWLTEGAQDYVSRIGAFGDMDPTQFIAGASPLQQQAWQNASQLGGWRPQAATAAGMAFNAGTRGANTAGRPNGAMNDPRGNPRGIGTPMSTYASVGSHGPQMGAPQGNPKDNPMAGPQVAQGTSPLDPKFDGRVTETTGFLPANGQAPANPGLVSGQGYSPAPEAPGYAMPRTGQPIGYQAPQGTEFNPALTGASQAAAYENPYQQQVIDTSLQGYDQNVGQQQAQMAANAARNGAFGGSRYGIAEGQFGADSALGRGQLESGLRSQGFQYANQMGMQDAAAGNNMYQFDAQQRDNADNRALAAAGLLGQQASQYGADTRADLGTMAALGDQQRGIEQGYAAAPLAQLEAMGSLMGATPYQILTGQQIDSTGSMQGTNVTRTSPSLFQSLLSGAGAAAMFI